MSCHPTVLSQADSLSIPPLPPKQVLADLASRGRKVESLQRALQRFSDPAEYVGRQPALTLALMKREAALALFNLGGKRGKEAEAKLYQAHVDQYVAEREQREGGLRRSSRTSTRASTAAAAKGGGVLSLLGGQEEARVRACVYVGVGLCRRGFGIGSSVMRRAFDDSTFSSIIRLTIPSSPSHPPLEQVLFKFPLEEEEVDRVTLTTLDRERLDPGEFLNDNVIDFDFKCVWMDVGRVPCPACVLVGGTRVLLGIWRG
jgi:hypothetical protein